VNHQAFICSIHFSPVSGACSPLKPATKAEVLESILQRRINECCKILILQRIALGHGVGLNDPHGDLAEELLNHIPPRRAAWVWFLPPL
jgi:hypothetical protein